MVRAAFRILLGLLFIAAGANHLLNPAFYLSFMPPWLPWPEAMNYISGAAEIAGGIGVFIPSLRSTAGWGLIALLIAVFPANIHIALHGMHGVDIPTWVLWARLPFQIVFIAWVYWTCLAPKPQQR
ncbi:MAG TPA: DoxX family membrane protein [Candidatus Saccharimonadia bacterium]|nr:DoxX family membrane protein [Candidatus Saccharimonadia bacterium]